MYGGLDISVSGMVAQRARIDTIAANLANRDAVADANGNYNPFRRKIALLMPGDPSARTPEGRELGAHVAQIVSDQAPLRKVYDPSHPFADETGYVDMPNVDPVIEQINLIEASRAYEANVTAAEVTKSLVAQALRMIGA